MRSSRSLPFRALSALLLLAAGAAGCDPRAEHVLSGRTMGTTYSVKLVGRPWSGTEALQKKIDRRLAELNRSLSPFLPESEISRFNRFAAAGEAFAVSADFRRVFEAAQRVHGWSGGAFDPTVGPLVDLWGFGRGKPRAEPPSEEEIARARAAVGLSRVSLRGEAGLVKEDPRVSLDFSAVAKGYGVDEVARLLREAGWRDFLVEIGGEVFAAGRRRDGAPWHIGIARPDSRARPDEVYRVVALSDAALATSGDYRQFFVHEGRRYSHVVDPQSGRPVARGVVSASVLAPDCMTADALATAVMVLGAEEGIALLERLENVEGLILVETAEGGLLERATSGFPPPAKPRPR